LVTAPTTPAGGRPLSTDRRNPRSEKAATVLDAFTRARMLTQQQDSVEITHDALLRAWPRLRAWIDTDRAGNLVRQELEDAAIVWNGNRTDTPYCCGVVAWTLSAPGPTPILVVT